MDLTPQQTAFISALFSGTANLRLDAVAGAGKTTTLVAACTALPAKASICATAFNTRIAKALVDKMPSSVTSKTFNAIGHRAFGQALGRRLTLNADKLDELGLTIQANYGEISTVKWAKSTGIKPEALTPEMVEDHAEAREYHKPPRFSKVFDLLNLSIAKAREGLIDFDDQIYMSVLYQGVWDRHDFVLVDEAQDLSPLQMDMIRKLGRQSCKFAFIGDPNQAIYGFRGAGITSMDDAADRFSTENLPLTVSFRCPQRVVDLAREIVPQIESAPGAPLGTIRDWRGSPWDLSKLNPGEVILSRNNAPLISLAMRLFQARRPARVLGRDVGASLLRFLKKFSTGNDRSSDLADRALQRLNDDLNQAQTQRKLSRVQSLTDRIETIEAMLSFAPPLWSEWEFQLREIFNPPSGNCIILSTIHKAKGLEWPSVHFLNRSALPSKRAKPGWELQQESNLIYVALTRVVGDGTLTFLETEDMKND